MLLPTAEAFAVLARRGNLVPVVREVLADCDTPLSVFRKLDDGSTSFLLESVEGGERWARYSFIGTGARAIFRARGQRVEWFEGGQTLVIGDKIPSQDYVKRLNEVPGLKKEVQQFLQKTAGAAPEKAQAALTASAVEFILEGLHVSNRLNKSQREGQAVYKR